MKKSSKSLFPLLFAAAAFFSLSLPACKSGRFYLPGQEKVVINSIFSEYYAIAEEYFKIKNYSKAADFYLKAAGSEEFANAAYFKAARSYALSKNWSKALEIYLAIEKQDPKNLTVKESLAYIYAMTGSFENSKSMYESLIQENPDTAEIYVNYTIVLITLEKYDEAKAELDVIKEKFPDEEKIKSLEEKISSALTVSKDESEGKIPEELRKDSE